MMRTKAETRGQRIRRARLARGLSQQTLADTVAGGHQSTIAAYESDRREMAIETLTLVARALSVSSDWILGLSDDGGPE